jgi:hypothetical protein
MSDSFLVESEDATIYIRERTKQLQASQPINEGDKRNDN